MVLFALFEQAQRQLLFRRILGIRRWFARTMLRWNTLLFQNPLLFIPGRQLRGRHVEGKPQRDGDFGGNEQEKDETLAQDAATAFFVPQFVKLGNLLGGISALFIGIVHDETAVRDAIVAEQQPHTGHEEQLPGNLRVAKHPG